MNQHTLAGGISLPLFIRAESGIIVPCLMDGPSDLCEIAAEGKLYARIGDYWLAVKLEEVKL